MKKYDNKNNVLGSLITKYRKERNLSKTELSKMLQLHAVYLDITEINRIETGRMIVKDFELIAFCKTLNIEYEDIKNLIE